MRVSRLQRGALGKLKEELTGPQGAHTGSVRVRKMSSPLGGVVLSRLVAAGYSPANNGTGQGAERGPKHREHRQL